jgi:CubicO group peptidase (beta-lactamase class C family)
LRLIIVEFAILVALFSFSGMATAQVSTSAIDGLFSKFVSARDPGCALLVIKDGKPVIRKGYGVAD